MKGCWRMCGVTSETDSPNTSRFTCGSHTWLLVCRWVSLCDLGVWLWVRILAMHVWLSVFIWLGLLLRWWHLFVLFKQIAMGRRQHKTEKINTVQCSKAYNQVMDQRRNQAVVIQWNKCIKQLTVSPVIRMPLSVCVYTRMQTYWEKNFVKW